MVGWYHGIPADNVRLARLEAEQTDCRFSLQHERNQGIKDLQSIVELIQGTNGSEDAINQLNVLIDQRISREHTGWEGYPSGLLWSGGEDQLQLYLGIAKYRQSYPVTYPRTSLRDNAEKVLKAADDCRLLRASKPHWKAPPTTTAFFEVQMIEPTNAPYSSPASRVQKR